MRIRVRLFRARRLSLPVQRSRRSWCWGKSCWSRSPLMAGCMAIFMLSLAGIPPLAGFFGKFYLFSVALRASPNHGLLWLVALALLGSFISLYYYLMVLKFVFVDKRAEASVDRSSLFSHHGLAKVTISLLAAAVLRRGTVRNFGKKNAIKA